MMACRRDKEANRGGDGHRHGEARAYKGWSSESPLSCTLCRCLIGGCAGGEVSDPGAGGWREQGDQAWGFSPCARHPFPEMNYCSGLMSQICHLVALGTIAEGATRQQQPREGHGTGAAWHAAQHLLPQRLSPECFCFWFTHGDPKSLWSLE